MPIKVSRQKLSNALSWVSRALPSRPSNPSLAGIKISVKDGTLTASAFDYEQSTAAVLDVSGDDMEVLVSGRLINDLVKASAGDTVELETEGANKLHMKAGKSKFVLPLMPLNEFPDLPAVPEKFGTVAGNKFSEAIQEVVVASGNDATLTVLTGIHVTVDPERKKISFAATDRYRLAALEIDYLPEEGQNKEKLVFLVPGRLLDTYGKAFDSETLIGLHHGGENNSLFGISGEGKVGTTRLLDGQFPKYDTLIPTEFTAAAVVSTNELIAAVKRVTLVASSKSQSVKLVLTENNLNVSVGEGGSAIGQYASEDIDVEYEGEEFTVMFNPGYLMDGLSALPSSEAKINLVVQTKPVLLTDATGESQYKYLLMPVRS